MSFYDKERPSSYPLADVVLICFSIKYSQTFKNVREIVSFKFLFEIKIKFCQKFKWIPEMAKHCPNARLILIGTQSDYRNEYQHYKAVTEIEGKQLAREMNAYKYLECSIVTEVFEFKDFIFFFFN